MKIKSFFLFLFLTAVFCCPDAAIAKADDAYDVLARIPVQHGGRIKPFETFAKEAVLFVTEKKSFKGIRPVELVWRWINEPEKWVQTPMLPLHYEPLREEFSIMAIGKRISPEIVLNHQPFIAAAQEAAQKRSIKEKLSFKEEKRLQLYEKAALFSEIGHGTIPGWVAHPDNVFASWLTLETVLGHQGSSLLASFYPQDKAVAFQEALRVLFDSFQTGAESSVQYEAALNVEKALRELHASGGVVLNQGLLETEVLYNRVNAFHWAWQIYLLSVLLVVVGMLFPEKFRFVRRFAFGSSVAAYLGGFVLHSYGFYLRCIIAGRPPVSNMYESVIWVSWAVVFFSLFLAAAYRTPLIHLFAAIVAALALMIAQGFPAFLDPFISPLVPVLRSNLWLTIHVLTITLSYGAFALAWGLGHASVFSFVFLPQKKDLQERLTLFLYRGVQIGIVLLAAGTVLGGVWANYSWGRFWGWDPKETWALIALLGYVAVLHGRFAGWLGPFGFSVAVVVAFLGILMAWYGVNFVLAAGLHSYGFGGGGFPSVAAVASTDLLLLAVAAYLYNRKTRSA